MFGGNAGLAVTQSMAIVVLMQYGMKQFTEVANEMTSVKHIMDYIQLQDESTINLPAGIYFTKVPKKIGVI